MRSGSNIRRIVVFTAVGILIITIATWVLVRNADRSSLGDANTFQEEYLLEGINPIQKETTETIPSTRVSSIENNREEGRVIKITPSSSAVRGTDQASQESESYRQGITVSQNGHWLEVDGRDVLLIGDSLTQGWMELGANFDQVAYLDALNRRGINAVLIWSYIGIDDQVGDERIGYDAPEIWPWMKTARGFDLAQFNETYFSRLREFVGFANQKGITVIITVHDGGVKWRWSGHPFNEKNGGPLSDKSQFVELHDDQSEMPSTYNRDWNRRQKHQYYLEEFCRRLIESTGDMPNVMYEIFNEGEWYDQDDLRAFQVHFLEFFKARVNRPLLVNDDHVGGASFRSEPDAGIISLHRPNWDKNSSTRRFFNHYQNQFIELPAKPTFFSETVPAYSGEVDDLDALVRLLWGTLLGGAGVVIQNDTSFGFDQQTIMATKTRERDELLDLEGHAASFFIEHIQNLSDLAPDNRVCSTGVCLANPGFEYVVYTEEGQNFSVNLQAASGQFDAKWYNPKTGDELVEGSITGGNRWQFTPPDREDWILHLRIDDSID